GRLRQAPGTTSSSARATSFPRSSKDESPTKWGKVPPAERSGAGGRGKGRTRAGSYRVSHRRRSAAEPGVGGRAEPVRGPTACGVGGGAPRSRGSGEGREPDRESRGAGAGPGRGTWGPPGRGGR